MKNYEIIVNNCYYIIHLNNPDKIKQRKIRIYNRDCVLQSTNEVMDQLEHPLCWRY